VKKIYQAAGVLYVKEIELVNVQVLISLEKVVNDLCADAYRNEVGMIEKIRQYFKRRKLFIAFSYDLLKILYLLVSSH
jgi:hypothetical protein